MDDQDQAKATLVPAADGAGCDVLARQPGAIRVTATLGTTASHIIVVATTDPAPGTPVDVTIAGDPGNRGFYMVPFYFPKLARVVNSAADWTSYWQGVAAYTAQSAYTGGVSGNLAVPPLPAVDFTTSSLVVISETVGDAGSQSVLAAVDVSGQGLVTIGTPAQENSAPGIGAHEDFFQALRVPKLPATTRVEFDCRTLNGCVSPEVLPSPNALQGLVGQAIDLPASSQGIRLTWSLAVRTAARATLVANHLTPTAPGGLVLYVSDGSRTGPILDAIEAAPPVDAGFDSPYGVDGHAESLNGPRLVNTDADWTALWNSLWGGPAFAPLLDVGSPGPVPATVGPTGPPPPPDRPAVDFSTRSVLAINNRGGQRPVLTSIDGNTVHLVIPQMAPNLTTPLPAPSAYSGQPVPENPANQTNVVYLYNIPRQAGLPTIAYELFPESDDFAPPP